MQREGSEEPYVEPPHTSQSLVDQCYVNVPLQILLQQQLLAWCHVFLGQKQGASKVSLSAC